MPVVGIRVMGVAVAHWRMVMRVGVPAVEVLAVHMRMLVVRIVNMRMVVFQRFVVMGMRMVLGQVQPHAECHESTRGAQLGTDRLTTEQRQ